MMLRAFHWLRISFSSTEKFFHRCLRSNPATGKTYNPVTGIWNTLHFHSSFGTYEENLRVGDTTLLWR